MPAEYIRRCKTIPDSLKPDGNYDMAYKSIRHGRVEGDVKSTDVETIGHTCLR